MKKILIIMASFIILLTSTICFADDAALYAIINGKSWQLNSGSTAYILKFAGFDDAEYSGTAYLMWPDTVVVDGYRYPISRKMLLPFMVWNGTVGIDVSDAEGNVTVFDFIVDYEGALIQVCPDLRFFPKGESDAN